MQFKIFKKIHIGGISKDDLYEKLAKNNIDLNNYAKTLIGDSSFSINKEIRQVTLVKASCRDLGFKDSPYYKEMIKVANSNGLRECPLCLAAFLRISYKEQAEGPYLHVASVKPKDDEEYPNGFYLRNIENKLWLRGYRASDDYEWPLDEEIIFLLASS